MRLLNQDWRSGELYLLASALILTVAAITAVGFFTDRVEGAMARQGGELIAADLALESATPVPATYAEQARALGLETARFIDFRSVVLSDAGPQLVQVKAVDPAYPLRGQLQVRDGLEAPETPTTTGPPPGEAWVEARLLHLLEARLGDEVTLGETNLRLGAILSDEPDRAGALFAMAPRILINETDLAATGLISEASRAEHRLLIAGEASRVERYRSGIATSLPVNLRLIDAADARPEFAAAVERASRFLHLATLVTLLVAGAAIALASHRFVERQTDAVAVMRCLGAPHHLLMRIFILRLLAFGLVASLVGCLIGWLGQLGLSLMLAEWFTTDLPPPSWTPVLVGLATGLLALSGFALPPLFQLSQVSPLRALRRDLGPPRGSAILTVLVAALAMALLIVWQAGDLQLAWKLIAGVLGAVLSLVLVVLLLVRIAGRIAGRARGVWRLGLAALARRPTGAVLQISGLGIGILALLLLAVVRVDLLRAWQENLPLGAPNHFLINIQPQDVEPLQEFLRESGVTAQESAQPRDASADVGATRIDPMIRGRLIRVNARSVSPSDFADPRAERLASREFNLSYATQLQPDNRIRAGSWWSGEDAQAQFSVEEGIAETLGIRLGDEITFLVSGREVSAPVTSLREVRWDSFNVNFFVISSPSVLAAEPATFITSFFLPRDRASLVAELVRQFPSVTVLDVDALLAQVRQVVDRGAMAIEYVFLFTLAAGLLVMYAGIQASLEERQREHGILRTLGTGRRALLTSLAVEFTAAGLIAGTLASVFAGLIGWLLAEQLFGLTLTFNPSLWLFGVLGSALLIGLAGTIATYPLLIRPPLRAIRDAVSGGG
nr:FtsX-like permease family protein [Thiocapsa imhoffii]